MTNLCYRFIRFSNISIQNPNKLIELKKYFKETRKAYFSFTTTLMQKYNIKEGKDSERKLSCLRIFG